MVLGGGNYLLSFLCVEYLMRSALLFLILEKRKLENRRDAFLETTKLVSGKAGSKPGGKVLQGSPACSPGETAVLLCGQ